MTISQRSASEAASHLVQIPPPQEGGSERLPSSKQGACFVQRFTNRERLHALLDVLGYLYMSYGKPERARDYFRLLVKLRPSESRLLRSLAKSELEAGNPEAARAMLEESLGMSMTQQERAATFLLLSRTFLRLQQFDSAAVAAHEFLNLKG